MPLSYSLLAVVGFLAGQTALWALRRGALVAGGFWPAWATAIGTASFAAAWYEGFFNWLLFLGMVLGGATSVGLPLPVGVGVRRLLRA